MFSLFKKKIPLIQYCTTILNTIFSEEMASQFMRIKTGIPEPSISEAEQQVYLDEMYGAYLQLFSIAITKQYKDFQISMNVSMCIDSYLTKKFGTKDLRNVADAYNKAFGNSAQDGVLEMVKLFSLRIANSELSQDAVDGFRELFYLFLSSILKDLEKVKLVN
jgi:hypothetical protein